MALQDDQYVAQGDGMGITDPKTVINGKSVSKTQSIIAQYMSVLTPSKGVFNCLRMLLPAPSAPTRNFARILSIFPDFSFLTEAWTG